MLLILDSKLSKITYKSKSIETLQNGLFYKVQISVQSKFNVLKNIFLKKTCKKKIILHQNW